jgi:hypothetical protein
MNLDPDGCTRLAGLARLGGDRLVAFQRLIELGAVVVDSDKAPDAMMVNLAELTNQAAAASRGA